MPQGFGHITVGTYEKGPLWHSPDTLSEQSTYIRAAQGPSGSQAGVGSIMVFTLASVGGRRVPQDVQCTHAVADRDPWESLQLWSWCQGSQGYCSWKRRRGLVLSFIISTQGSSNVYPLLLIYSNRTWRKCKISKGICKYNFFLVGHCHRNYCYRI